MPIGRLPDFIVIGAMRAGTTSLVRYLDEHPAVYIAPGKELHYFDRHFDNGGGWYPARFAEAPPDALVGEATTRYLTDDRVPERMAAIVPTVKLIAVLRDPASRAYSHYWMNRAMGREKLSFEQAIRQEDARTRSAEDAQTFGYVRRSRYLVCLERYLEHFPREALMPILFEHLRGDALRTYRDVCRFLGLRDSLVPTNLGRPINRFTTYRWPTLQRLGRSAPYPLAKAIGRLNRRNDRYPDMDPRLRRELMAQFEPDFERLAQLTGLDLSVWSSP